MIDRRDALAREARQWVGTRWHHQASAKGIGTDCIGLVAGVAAACGVAEAGEFFASREFRGYGREPDPALLLGGCDRWLTRIPAGAARIGDVLVFKFRIEPQHFAIVSRDDPLYIVHAYAQVRRVVENRLDDAWRARVVRAYCFRGLD